ncbi:MAG: type I glutamate--ammonia ligase [Proteobacteria bacterium]|nr:type I glutamate--ammonia ligase [Pseudomonadota bacterium]
MPKNAVKMAKDHGATMIDLKFMDFIGTWQHFSVPVSELSEDMFEDGFGFDGSSIRGWQPIHASDMLVLPDPSTALMDPFIKEPTLSFICNIYDPITKEPYSRDPRNIAKKAEAYLKSSGIGDTAYFGPEPEFFIFDGIRYSQGPDHGFYEIDSEEGEWNTGRDEGPNLGHKPRHKQGYFPCLPTDSLNDIRNEMVMTLQRLGFHIEMQHHEVASGGQGEIAMKFNSLLKMGDQLKWYKYVVKNVAKANGKTATFMPKPVFNDNGTGMHCHQSIWKDGENLFAGDGYAGMSEMALHYIGGILKHARALNAICNPSTNSYKRLVPGYEAPINLAYSSRNRSASIRIPIVNSPKAKRIEARFPDPSCNGYLAMSALLMAGLDGIENKIDPGDPMDKNIYGLSPEELANIPSAATSLEEALDALRNDHEFLLKGDVFTEDVIETWIEYKEENDLKLMRMTPCPQEFTLYYDC